MPTDKKITEVKAMKICRVFPLIALALLLALAANAVGEEIPRPFLRFDLDSPDACTGLFPVSAS